VMEKSSINSHAQIKRESGRALSLHASVLMELGVRVTKLIQNAFAGEGRDVDIRDEGNLTGILG